ncbi:MAG: serine hydrolase [Bdellovibrionales bacterium]|nr:serine hydrolase [Bdellovibrionales bacterium]
MKNYLFASFLTLLGCSTNTHIENRTISNTPDQNSTTAWIDQAKEISQESVESGYNAGIALGIIDETGQQSIYTFGKMDVLKNKPITKSTIFEIGSITKVLTAELLAKFVVEGKLSLDDEVKKFIPSLSASDAGRITLRELSTHTSGLPRLASNMNPKDPTNPYADYTLEQMMSFFKNYKEIKTRPFSYSYSNLGFGLLGQILSDLNSKTYEVVLKKEILSSLNIPMTITLTRAQNMLFATPYSLTAAKTSHWDIGIINGAGGLRATIQDLLDFAKTQLHPESTTFQEAILLSQQTHYKSKNMQMGLGWVIRDHSDGLIFSKDGGTGGFGSLILIQPKTGRALAMISNSANIVPCLINFFKKETCDVKKVYPMSVEKLKRLLGNFENEQGQKINIILSENKKFIFGVIPNQPTWVLKSESETVFNFMDIDASIVFPDGVEPINSFVLKQGGKDYIYKKVETLSN